MIIGNTSVINRICWEIIRKFRNVVMSSLAGIRFIPKSEREKEEKKKKHKKEKKGKKEKDLRHQRDQKRKEDDSSSSSSSSSDDERDGEKDKKRKKKSKNEKKYLRCNEKNEKRRKREEEKEKEEEEEFDVLKEEERMNQLIEEMNEKEGIRYDEKKKFGRDGRSILDEEIMMNKRSKGDDGEREEGENDDEKPVIVELSSNELDQYVNIPNTVLTETKPDTSTNMGFASLLRARLKNPSATEEAFPQPTKTSSSDISFMSKEEMKWMSSYTRRTSDKLDDDEPKSHAPSTRYKILDDREDDIDSILVSNILKKGTNFKGTELGLSGVSLSREGIGSGDRSGKDEGNENGDGEIDMKMLVSKDRKLSDAEIAKKILQKAEKTSKIYAQVVFSNINSLIHVDCRKLFTLSK